MSRFHILTNFSGKKSSLVSSSRLHPTYLTRTYFAVGASLLMLGALTAALTTRNAPAESVNATSQNQAQHATSEPLIPEQPEAAKPDQADDTTQTVEGSTATNSQSVSVNSTESGTTVNVNGRTSTIPADGSLDKTYSTDSTDGSSPSSVHISIENSSQSTAGSSRNSHVSVRSQTRVEGRSSTNTTTQSSN